MGYDLHIVRRKNWDDYEEESTISLEEWLAYVQTDEELVLTNGYQVRIPGVENSFQNVPGFCNWNGHSTKSGDDKPWFDYGYGMISTKYPDNETIRKMLDIATKFDGRVQGDDGEFYGEDYFMNLAKENMNRSSKRPDPRPWWKFW
jgi:hypothetical protein